MNKTTLISYIAEKNDMTKVDAEKILDSFMEAVTKTLKKGDQIALTGFGTFSITHRKARTARNPRTGEAIKVKATKAPKFKAGKKLKEAVK